MSIDIGPMATSKKESDRKAPTRHWKFSRCLIPKHYPEDGNFGWSFAQTSKLSVWIFRRQVYPAGLIQLPIKIAGVRIPALFHVVDAHRAFTGILGRAWLDSIRVVSSALHRCLGFYSPKGEHVTVYADIILDKQVQHSSVSYCYRNNSDQEI